MRLREFIDRIIEDGTITPDEHAELVRRVTEDPELSSEERDEIARLRELIARGEVRLVGATPGAD